MAIKLTNNSIKITFAAGYREEDGPHADTTFEIIATVNGETFEIGELTAERSGWNRDTGEWVNDIGYLNYAAAWKVSEYRFDLGLDIVTFESEAVIRGEFPTLGQWLRASEVYASIETFETRPFVPGSSQRLKQTAATTKREAKERIAELVEAYLEALALFETEPEPETETETEPETETETDQHPIVIDDPEAFDAMCEKLAAANRERLDTEAAHDAEPMRAREHKMRGDLECILTAIQQRMDKHQESDVQVDAQGDQIENPLVDFVGRFLIRSLEGVLGGSMGGMSDRGAGGLVDWTAIPQVDLTVVSENFEAFKTQVSDFRRHHFNDGAWCVPAGSTIDAECERIDSMKNLGQVKAYLDVYMGPGQFEDEVETFVNGYDARPRPEDMTPDQVSDFLIEFSALSTWSGAQYGRLLSSDAASPVLSDMTEDHEYLARFVNIARENAIQKRFDTAIPISQGAK